MTNIAVILGSTRPNRVGAAVAEWVYEQARQRDDATFELVDLADFDLPLLDEPYPPSMNMYQHEHTKTWSAKIAEFDGYVFVSAEYNHSVPAALKNALDYLYYEWHNKAAGFVSYGGDSGLRVVEHLRGVAAELHLADVQATVNFSLITDFENYSVFQPKSRHGEALTTMLDQLATWSEAMCAVRSTSADVAA